MQDINPELVRMLYAKYSPDTDVESKLEYIQEKYGDNQEEFVRSFYAKYEPNVDVGAKLKYISKAYPVKKKDEITASSGQDQSIPTTLDTETQTEQPVSDTSDFQPPTASGAEINQIQEQADPQVEDQPSKEIDRGQRRG